MQDKSHSIKKLFIANRGEICRRIAIAAKELGMQTATLCRQNHTPAFLAEVIDEFHFIEHDTPASYLDGDAVIEAALKLGCDAIHPGFGFLSENKAFAQNVVNAGMTWVGPNSSAIASMASKATARDIAVAAKVPCLDGLSDLDFENESRFLEQTKPFVESYGFPVLLKAAMGGGGKGMRIVYDADELWTQAQRAHSEAVNAFGDGSLIIEPYVQKPRHIEVQILADSHGNVAAIGDRDCSVQRRHQKIVEECPAPGLHESVRKAMAEAAIRLAKQVGYDSVGTVEFLVDWAQPEKQPFYFLEMNTRLQVEHPVTEQAFGIDLVQWQLKVAQGFKLSEQVLAEQKPMQHSVEVRIYAEDPTQDFFPSPGPLIGFHPFHGPGIRWEQGVDSCDEVSASFDPMIAKLIATGADREQAISRLIMALEKSVIAGLKHNQTFLIQLLKEPHFADGSVTTAYLAERNQSILDECEISQKRAEPDMQIMLSKLTNGLLDSDPGDASAPERHVSHLFRKSAQRNTASAGKNPTEIRNLNIETNPRVAGGMRVRSALAIAGPKEPSMWVGAAKFVDRLEYWVCSQGLSIHQTIAERKVDGIRAQAAEQNQIVAPVPGKVVSVNTESGHAVQEGDILLVLESMKMEFEVRAETSGVVEQVMVEAGNRVDAGSLLISLE